VYKDVSMTMVARKPSPLLGHASPRVAPPVPARSDIAGFRETAASLDIELMPWQETAARYLTALAADDRWLYPEVAIVVARQNGKTTLLIPLIVQRLLRGQRIMHTAQDRNLPREVFGAVAEMMFTHHSDLFPHRNGRPTKPRYANGQEEIILTNGGVYSIVAPTSGGARGPSRDLIIIDELREMDSWGFIAASKPTRKASKNPQVVYLSNAGEDDSIVLNALRDRAATDPALAYLEWSASPERSADDREGWAEANPAMGNEKGEMGPVLETLEADYRTALLEHTTAIFEVENLCRWVVTTRERLVDEYAWGRCEGEVETPKRPSMAVSMDPDGERASAAIAWQAGDDIAMRLIFDVTGHPIDTDALGADLKKAASRLGVHEVGYDPLTDAELAKFFKKTRKVQGSEYANASSRFVTIVNAGRLKWSDAAAVTDDLSFTAKKPHDESGSFQAVRAKDDRPIPAALAAIRAVYLASGPKTATPRVM
jgi:hypothetical protein